MSDVPDGPLVEYIPGIMSLINEYDLIFPFDLYDELNCIVTWLMLVTADPESKLIYYRKKWGFSFKILYIVFPKKIVSVFNQTRFL